MAIDRKIVEYVAHLSRIELREEELEKLSSQLQHIVGFIDKLKEADIQDIAPTNYILSLHNVWREDALTDSLPAEKVLDNAPLKKNTFFVVPKVME